jgi:16S rRNA processing protein RimM
MNSTIYVAKIGKTVGLKGDLKFHLDTDFENQFSKDNSFTLKNKTTLVIEYYNPKRGVIKFIGINSVEDAKKLTNQEVYSTIEDTKSNCKLDDNQYFWFDIIGCDLIENDMIIGNIKDIDRFGVTDYLKIITDENLSKKLDKELPKEFLLPYIQDKFILDVDTKTKKIIVNGAMDILENS